MALLLFLNLLTVSTKKKQSVISRLFSLPVWTCARFTSRFILGVCMGTWFAHLILLLKNMANRLAAATVTRLERCACKLVLAVYPPSFPDQVTMGTRRAVVRMWGPWEWESSCVHLRCSSSAGLPSPRRAPAWPDLFFSTERGVTHHSGFKTGHERGGGRQLTLKALFKLVLQLNSRFTHQFIRATEYVWAISHRACRWF